MKSFVFKGTLKSSDDKSQQVIDINMPQNGLSIRGLTKSILEVDKNLVPDDNGVYVLESEDKCYVGQSKNLRDRLKNHFANNKINHSRIFFLHKKDDIRGYLDYMEKRLFKSMSDEGYDLANGTNLDPELDRLDIEEKRLVDTWINEFLTFLPILGFRKEAVKKEESILAISKPTETITQLSQNITNSDDKIKQKEINTDIDSSKARDLIKFYMAQIPLEKIINSKAVNDSLDIRKNPFINKYTKSNCQTMTNKYGEQLYFIMNMNLKTARRKLAILKEIYETCENQAKMTESTKKEMPTKDKSPLREKLFKLLSEISYKEIIEIENFLSTSVDIRLEPFNKRYKPFTPAKEIENVYGEKIYVALNIDNVMLEKKIKILENKRYNSN